jgi:F-type H+-transporting ATPase subunit delta
MKSGVARRYAKALFDLLDQPGLEPARTALIGLGQAYRESAALRHTMASPVFSEQDKVAVLSEVAERLGCPSVGKSFLAQLIKNNRVPFLSDIAEAFSTLVDEAKTRQPVGVWSAAALSSADQEQIRATLRETLRREVEVEFHTDSQALGGLHIRIGSTVVDSTIRSRLRAIQTLLTKE